MAEESEKPKLSDTAENFFVKDRGERAYYKAASASDPVRLPLTRDGFEAMLELSASQFDPPLPVNDSMRAVFAGYVHHLTNETNITSIETIGKILYKSVTNALTWTIDQEVKKKRQDEATAFAAKCKADAEEAERKAKVESAADKRQKKANKYGVKTKSKSNEAKAN